MNTSLTSTVVGTFIVCALCGGFLDGRHLFLFPRVKANCSGQDDFIESQKVEKTLNKSDENYNSFKKFTLK